jgi:TonB family protein
MPFRGWLTLALGLVILQRFAVADMQSPSANLPAFPELSTIEQVDQTLSNMKENIWAQAQSTTSQPSDAYGHTLADDLSEFVLSEASLRRYAQLHAQAEKEIAAHPDNVHEILQPLRNLLYTEMMRTIRLTVYSASQDAFRYHRGTIESLIRIGSEDESKKWRLELEGIDAKLRAFRADTAQVALTTDRVPLDVFAEWNESFLAWIPAYNSLRLNILARLPSTVRSSLNVASKVRQDACADPVTRSDGGLGLKMLSAPNADDYYPDLMRKYVVEGVVRITVNVSAGGCVTRARIEETSGSPELDDAGLNFALVIRFLPPLRDGVQVESDGIIPIRFKMPH